MIVGNVILILTADYKFLEGMECPRQLIPIAGEPLLQRTWKQIQPYGFHNFVVTPHEQIQRLFPFCFEPGRYDYGAQTFLSTRPVWGTRTFILLGDVLYSGEAISMIMSDENDVGFYGDRHEICGIVFDRTQFDTIATALEGVGTHKPWLWVFYRLFCGFGVKEHSFDNRYHFLPDGDLTRDFDTIKVYRDYLEKHPWARS